MIILFTMLYAYKEMTFYKFSKEFIGLEIIPKYLQQMKTFNLKYFMRSKLKR